MPAAQGHMTVHRRPKDGLPGADGKNGCILRSSIWKAGVAYHNDTGKAQEVKYLDVVYTEEGVNQYHFWQCREDHLSTIDNGPDTQLGKARYWKDVNDMGTIFTPLLIAENAMIKFGQTNRLLVLREDGTTVNVGLGGGRYPLWIGHDNPEQAPYRISDDGSFFANKAHIEGDLEMRSGNHITMTDAQGNQTLRISDDIQEFGSGLAVYGGSLDWKVNFKGKQSGHREGSPYDGWDYYTDWEAKHTNQIMWQTIIPPFTVNDSKATISIPSFSVNINPRLSDTRITNLNVQVVLCTLNAHSIVENLTNIISFSETSSAREYVTAAIERPITPGTYQVAIYCDADVQFDRFSAERGVDPPPNAEISMASPSAVVRISNSNIGKSFVIAKNGVQIGLGQNFFVQFFENKDTQEPSIILAGNTPNGVCGFKIDKEGLWVALGDDKGWGLLKNRFTPNY